VKIKKLRLQNFRCFEFAEVELDNITVFTGHNNSGKSSILKAVSCLQNGLTPTPADIRVGFQELKIQMMAEDVERIPGYNISKPIDKVLIDVKMQRGGGLNLSATYNGLLQSWNIFNNVEPDHLIIPYLSKRKVPTYSESVNEEATRAVSDMTYLAAKISRIINPTFPGHYEFKERCEAILGFMLTVVPSQNGQKPGIYLPGGEILTLNEMGEGVPNIAALLIQLVTAKDKIFLIEEPENDLHPSSLKALLDMILLSSEKNQFIVSTHSNIVTQYLAGNDKSLYYVSRESVFPPTSSVRRIEYNVTARMEILRELGYSLSDFELWDGWLLLEESSAERIIRDFLIPNFVPGLSNVRTLAAGGVDDVEATFKDFHRMVRFTHLEEVYRHTTWVKVDGDAAGGAIIDRLKENYKSWGDTKFSQFDKEQFEHYYPKVFSHKVEAALAITDKSKKRNAKRDLLNEVISWLQEDKERAVQALAESADEVIRFLKQVEVSVAHVK
jgi:predicted ATP-dependent endonuclease of OLD family